MNDQRINPSSGTMQQQRLPYTKREVVELDLVGNTEGKSFIYPSEFFSYNAPS